MAHFEVSNQAESDIDEIVAYSISAWGPERAGRYLIKLEEGFQRLAINPSLGRACKKLQPGLRRFEIEHHVAFYLPEPGGVFIVRVLHQSMLPNKHI